MAASIPLLRRAPFSISQYNNCTHRCIYLTNHKLKSLELLLQWWEKCKIAASSSTVRRQCLQLDLRVVVRRPLQAQTKESVRRDKRPSPTYCVDICFYCVAQKHLSLKNSCRSIFVNICYESYHLLVRLFSKTSVAQNQLSVCFHKHLL